jgi:uncharacterized membrane-anchored protein YitT (DUF2179 family)
MEIIIERAESLCKEITERLFLSATLIEARGGYSGKKEKIVLCVVKKEEVPLIEKIIAEYPDAVIFESVITSSVLHNH